MVIIFPIKGIHKGAITSEQPELTCTDSNNMRPVDQLGERFRGGQRLALEKMFTQQIGGAAQPVVAVCQVTVVS